MEFTPGLTRVVCPTVEREFLAPVKPMVDAGTIPCPIVNDACPPCQRSFSVAEIERGDSTLARVLTVLREQAVLRARMARSVPRRS